MKIPILKIPFTDDDKSFIQEGVSHILDSGFLIGGPYIAEFEKRFSEMCSVKHALAVSSGTAALELIIRGLGIKESSIIVPTNTFIATAFAVINSGNEVIFADSDPNTYSLDIEDAKRRVRPDTKAMIIVHIGGIISNQINELAQWCKENNIYLIEDCAHAHGSSWKGQAAGSIGIAGAFSMFPTKVLTTGEGGCVTTNDDRLAESMAIIRNHGKDAKLKNAINAVGDNMRMSAMTALVGVSQLRRVNEIFEARKSVARRYASLLQNTHGIKPLVLEKGMESTYYKYICVLDGGISRDALKTMMKDDFEVALTGEVYAGLCHEEPLWKKVNSRGNSLAGSQEQAWDGFPKAKQIAGEHVCLPLYPGLTDDEVDYVVNSLKTCLQHLSAMEGSAK